MTSFKLLYKFFKERKGLSIRKIADSLLVSEDIIKVWNKTGYRAQNTPPEMVCEKLFGDSIQLMKAFIDYVKSNGYEVDKSIQSDAITDSDAFVTLFLAKYLSTELKCTTDKENTTTSINPYDAVFAVLNCVMSTSLPDYSSLTNEDTKYCSISRATLVSLVKHCLNDDIDNDLSEEYSVEQLNETIQKNDNNFIKEFAKSGYNFKGKNGLIIVSKSNSPKGSAQDEYNDDMFFEMLKVLHEAYKSYDIHKYFSSKKKIELNCSISIFTNALAFRGVFNTVERKRYFCDIVSSLIETHNHDCNYLYPIMSNIQDNKKRPPLVDVGIEQMVKYVCDYCYDVYNTDNNALVFIPNFIQTLKYYDVAAAKKVAIFNELIYNEKTYDLRLVQALVLADPSQLSVIRGHFENNIFSLIKMPITESVKRELVSFACMFARGAFDILVSYDSPATPHFFDLLSNTINYIARRFEILVPISHIRRKDVAQGLAIAILTIKKHNGDVAKKCLENVSKENFKGNKLFEDTYDFVLFNKISVICAGVYLSNDEEFIKYTDDNLICSKNPFWEKNNPLLLYALSRIRSVHKKNPEILSFRLREFADNLLFWMLDVSEHDASQKRKPRYLNLLVDSYPNCISYERSREYKEKKTSLFVKIFKEQNENPDFALIPAQFYQKIWDAFRGKKYELNDELNKSIKIIFQNGKELDEIEFLLSNYWFLNADNKESINQYIRRLIDERTDLITISTVALDKIFNVIYYIEENIDKTIQNAIMELFVCFPHLNLKPVDAFNLCHKYLSRDVSEKIAKLLINGDESCKKFVDYLICSRYRSWQRAGLKNLLSNLLRPESFFALELNDQIKLIHYAKDKGEYYDDLINLMSYISDTKRFINLDTKLKTALTIHCHNYIDLKDPKNACFLEFLDDTLNYLTENAYTHFDIRTKFGLRTDTLIYHILETFKCRPDRTSIICLCSICKLYKQLLILSPEDAWNPYKSRLLIDRVRLFKTVVANPCIRNIAKHYVREMYMVINQNNLEEAFDSNLKTLKNLIVSICKDAWPNWFNVPNDCIVIQKEDTIQTDICIEKDLFLIDKNNSSYVPNDKAKEELRKWREKLDFSLPLHPANYNEVVALDLDGGYIPLSGWGVVYECLETDIDFYPSHIISTVVSLSEITPIIFKEQNRQLNYDIIVDRFNKLFSEIIALVPSEAQKKTSINKEKERFERIRIKEDYDAINKNTFVRLSAFLDFYYEYIFIKPRIKYYVLSPYYDYYIEVTENVLKKLKQDYNNQ